MCEVPCAYWQQGNAVVNSKVACGCGVIGCGERWQTNRPPRSFNDRQACYEPLSAGVRMLLFLLIRLCFLLDGSA